MEEVIIKFDSDVKDIQLAIDLLEKLGSIDKKTADGFRKNNAAHRSELDKTKSSVDGLSQAFAKTPSNIGAKAVEAAFLKLKETVIKTQAELRKTQFELEKLLDKANKKVPDKGPIIPPIPEGLPEKVDSVRGKLAGMRNEIVALKQAGKGESDQVKKLEKDYSDLNIIYQKTQKELKLMSSSSRGLTSIITIAQNIAGAFAIAEGAAGLLGGTNENLQKSLLKVQSAIAILNGLEVIHNSIKKGSIAASILEGDLSKIAFVNKIKEAAATTLQTGAESKNVVVRYAAAAAQAVLNAVQALSPIFLVIAAVVALVGAYYLLTGTTKDLTKAQAAMIEKERQQLEILELAIAEIKKYDLVRTKQLEHEKALLEKSGASLVAIREKERQLNKEKLDTAQKVLDRLAKENFNYDLQAERLHILTLAVYNYKEGIESGRIKDDDAAKKNVKNWEDEIANIQKALKIFTDATNDKVDAENKATEDIAANREKDRQSAILSQKSQLEAQIILNEAYHGKNFKLRQQQLIQLRDMELKEVNKTPGEKLLIEAKYQADLLDLQREELKLQLQVRLDELKAEEILFKNDAEIVASDKKNRIKAQANFDLKEVGISEAQKRLIYIKAQDDIATIEREYHLKKFQREYDLQVSILNTTLAVSQKESDAELEIKVQLLDAEYNLNIKNLELQKTDEVLYKAKLKELEITHLNQIQTLRNDARLREIDENNKQLISVANHQKNEQDLIINSLQTSVRDKEDAELEKLNIERQTLEKELQLFIDKLEFSNETDAELLRQRQELNDKLHRSDVDLANKTKAIDESRIGRIAAEASKIITAVTPIINNMYESEINSVNARYQTEEDRLQSMIDKRRENGESSKSLEKQLSDLEKKKTKETNELKLKEAKTDRDLAMFNIIINTYAAVAKAGGLLTPMGASAAIYGALAFAAVASKPLPQFEKGKKRDRGTPGWSLVGEGGPELQYIGRDTAIIPAGKSAQILREFNINQLNGFRAPVLDEQTKKYLMAKNSGAVASQVIDYAMMGKELGKAMKKVKGGKSTHINMDENGFSMRVIDGLASVKYMNSRIQDND